MRIPLSSTLLIAAAIAAAACGERSPPAMGTAKGTAAAPARDVPFVIRMQFRELLAHRIFADGQRVHEASRDNVLAARDAEIRFSARSGKPVITAQVELPCGWKEVELEFRGWAANSAPDHPGGGSAGPVTMDMTTKGSFPRDTVVVDNRGRPEASLRLGSARASIPADGVVPTFLYAPDCAEGLALELDGVTVGRIDAHPGPGAAHRSYLLDPSGKRCYENRYAVYGKAANEPMKPPTRYRRATLHAFPENLQHEFMFGGPAEKITVVRRFGEPEGSVVKPYLVEVPC